MCTAGLAQARNVYTMEFWTVKMLYWVLANEAAPPTSAIAQVGARSRDATHPPVWTSIWEEPPAR